jgi:bifunctional UDP-N-acetylglucosamine pyrophosphorylase / glucosamine-1-phosphate N-acetyltransferase
MDFEPKSHETIKRLIKKGVNIPNPGTIDIGGDVNVDRISGKDVIIYPGCRIYGGKTVISQGCRLGYEAPATIEDCQLGPLVELKGGFFSKSVFLEKAGMGSGAHVREGCLLEEEANGAHSVGLKQTILFPFVTLGSLINFCDCLMAGGTSRSSHSEVGSSYILFNFTPDADKTTPSLIGDVARGVMLNNPPIFLGGQGGIVGPVRLGYGNVVAAGSILRKDYLQNNQMIFDLPQARSTRDFIPASYPNLRRILENNIIFMANLKALSRWYANVRKPFFEAQEFGSLIYAGALDKLTLAQTERFSRLKTMAQKAADISPKNIKSKTASERKALHENMSHIEDILNDKINDAKIAKAAGAFLGDFEQSCENDRRQYIETIQKLPPKISTKGTQWLQSIVNYYCQRISSVIPFIKLFKAL